MREKEDNEEKAEDSSDVVSDKKKNRGQRFLNAALDITGINAVYGDVKDLFGNRDKKRQTGENKPVDKKTRRKNVFARIIKAVNVVCKTGIFLCKFMMKVVSPGVYVIEKILEKTLVAAKTAYDAMKAKNGKERAVVLADGALQLSGVLPSVKIGGNKLQGVVNTAGTITKATRTVIKDKDIVDGLIGATVVIGKDAFGKTAPGVLINDVHEYGNQLKKELRRQDDEFQTAKQKEDFSSKNEVNSDTVEQSSAPNGPQPDTNVTDPVQQSEQSSESPVQPVAENDFKTNMLSGHERLQQIREKVAVRQQNRGEDTPAAANDAALISELRCMAVRKSSVSRPQNFSAEQMLQLNKLRETTP